MENEANIHNSNPDPKRNDHCLILRTRSKGRYWKFTAHYPQASRVPSEKEAVQWFCEMSTKVTLDGSEWMKYAHYTRFQLELGEKGAYHIQGTLVLNEPLGIPYLNNFLRNLASVYWMRITKMELSHSIDYCSKVETRVKDHVFEATYI